MTHRDTVASTGHAALVYVLRGAGRIISGPGGGGGRDEATGGAAAASVAVRAGCMAVLRDDGAGVWLQVR